MKKYSLILTNEKGTLETMSIEIPNSMTTRETAKKLAWELAKARAIMINGNIRIGFSFSQKFTIDVRIGRKIHKSQSATAIVNGEKVMKHLETTFTASETKNKEGEIVRTKGQNFERKGNVIFRSIFETIELAKGEHWTQSEQIVIREAVPQMKFIG
jgi:hypothetical protein